MKLLVVSRELRIIAIDLEDNIPLGTRIMMGITPDFPQDPTKLRHLESRVFEWIENPESDDFERELVLYEEAT